MINAQLPNRQTLLFKRDLLIILGVGIAAIVVWIITSVIENLNTTSLAPIVQQQVEPLNPAIDEEVLDEVDKRRFFSDSELLNFPIMKATESASSTNNTTAPISTPTPTPSPTISPAETSPTESPTNQ